MEVVQWCNHNNLRKALTILLECRYVIHSSVEKRKRTLVMGVCRQNIQCHYK